jgi:hypothetical protein
MRLDMTPRPWPLLLVDEQQQQVVVFYITWSILLLFVGRLITKTEKQKATRTLIAVVLTCYYTSTTTSKDAMQLPPSFLLYSTMILPLVSQSQSINQPVSSLPVLYTSLRTTKSTNQHSKSLSHTSWTD